ncbi:hypothetical protein O3P69_007377 [Scylla paramamosain]|uniref:Uncharacterized protein n=1 Tax=Scylla paramamosain TaxID=85552 RepID=A0AAW0V4H2_SCYPA
MFVIPGIDSRYFHRGSPEGIVDMNEEAARDAVHSGGAADQGEAAVLSRVVRYAAISGQYTPGIFLSNLPSVGTLENELGEEQVAGRHVATKRKHLDDWNPSAAFPLVPASLHHFPFKAPKASSPRVSRPSQAVPGHESLVIYFSSSQESSRSGDVFPGVMVRSQCSETRSILLAPHQPLHACHLNASTYLFKKRRGRAGGWQAEAAAGIAAPQPRHAAVEERDRLRGAAELNSG